MRNYDDYENESNFQKFTHRKKKSHGKGHQSRHGKKGDAFADLYEEDYIPAPKHVNSQTPPKDNTPVTNINPHSTFGSTGEKTEHVFGPNTREIKHVKIDYDGVADIQKVDNSKDGVVTYGIKFVFKGKKGLFRIIWFNSNSRMRDSVYNTEYAFWKNLNKEGK